MPKGQPKGLYRRGATWYLDYYDHSGARVRRSTGTTKVTEARDQLTAALEEVRQRRLGIFDPARKHAATIVDKHVDDYATSLAAKDNTEEHNQNVINYIREFLTDTKVKALAELTLSRGEAWLLTKKKAGLSARAVNKRRGALLQWGRWLVRDRRMGYNPFDGLPVRDEKAGAIYERRAPTLKEIDRLFRVVPTLRRIVYELALVTGLRRRELEALRPDQLDEFDVLHLRPGEVKNRKKYQEAPLPPHLAAELRSMQNAETRRQLCRAASMRPTQDRGIEYLLPAVPEKATVYRDFKRAGIQRVVTRGDGVKVKVDFHSFRVAFGTYLEPAGVGLSTASSLMRHSDPRLTAIHYQKFTQDQKRQALGLLWQHLYAVLRPVTDADTAVSVPASNM